MASDELKTVLELLGGFDLGDLTPRSVARDWHRPPRRPGRLMSPGPADVALGG